MLDQILADQAAERDEGSGKEHGGGKEREVVRIDQAKHMVMIFLLKACILSLHPRLPIHH